jgi:hypothetical protein
MKLATIDDFMLAAVHTVLPVFTKHGLTEVQRIPMPPIVGSGPDDGGVFELRGTPTSLILRSAKLEASFGWEPREAAIHFHIRRADETLDLADLLAATHLPNPGMACRTVDLISSRLAWLAEFLDRHCKALLSGDDIEFARLASISKERQKAYNRGFTVEPAISRAKEAFHDKDYQTVIELLSPFEDQLTGAAAKTLEMARLRLGGTGSK